MRKKKAKKENGERWLLTYSDLITLLMIFFVMMYTLSNVDKEKYQKVSESLHFTFTGSQYVIGEGGDGQKGDGNEQGEVILSETTQLQEELKNYLKENDLERKVNLKVEPRGLVVSIKDSVFFESGKADIGKKYEENILDIGTLLNKLGCDIAIEGHTDNVPIHNSLYASNWELAAIRATNVVKLLVEKGGLDPAKISATSYGEYRTIASNATQEGRAKNRRIDIIVLNNNFYEEQTRASK